MTAWLILDVDLTFNDKLKPITSGYRGDLQASDSDIYYGMHFVSAPSTISPGDHLKMQMVLRAYPMDPCVSFQVGKRVLLKEGPLTRAEGVITGRREHESPANTLSELSRDLPIKL